MRLRDARAVAVAVAVAVAIATVIALGLGATADARSAPASAAGPARAWFSEARESAIQLLGGPRSGAPETVEKWITPDGDEFQRSRVDGRSLAPGQWGVSGGGPPGFGDWDLLGDSELPASVRGVDGFLRRRELSENGAADRAQRTSPLIHLAELGSMLADHPQTAAGRRAGFAALAALPGLRALGPATDPLGRRGVAVSETAANLHPFVIATGPGCHSPLGGRGCVGAATPDGRYTVELVYDPVHERILSMRTTAVSGIPAARIHAGQTLYAQTWLHSRAVSHPHIPPLPRPARPSVQSVPWTLVHAAGRGLTVSWQSGTCDPKLPARARIRAVVGPDAVTVTVLAHVERASRGTICAGVGLVGTLSTQLRTPLDGREVAHGTVTDHDR